MSPSPEQRHSSAAGADGHRARSCAIARTSAKAANLGRDELPKVFNCPVVLWVNDTTLQQLNRYAPDLKSFAATPLRFEYPTPSLMAV